MSAVRNMNRPEAALWSQVYMTILSGAWEALMRPVPAGGVIPVEMLFEARSKVLDTARAACCQEADRAVLELRRRTGGEAEDRTTNGGGDDNQSAAR